MANHDTAYRVHKRSLKQECGRQDGSQLPTACHMRRLILLSTSHLKEGKETLTRGGEKKTTKTKERKQKRMSIRDATDQDQSVKMMIYSLLKETKQAQLH